MDYLRIASLVPIAGCLAQVCENGPELLQTLPSLIIHITYSYLSPISSKVQVVWNDPDLFFLCILAFRYYRLIGHIFAYSCLYKPEPILVNPTVTSLNTHVVVPTVDPGNPAFEKCLQSILQHSPKWLTIVTGGPEYRPQALEVVANLQPLTNTTIRVITTTFPNKRHQMAMVLDELAENQQENKDIIIVFVDDHAWWDGDSFLAHLLAPFENAKIGLVGTKKRVERDQGHSLWQSFVNFLGCTYLERHNFELTATNAMDGGVFVISARTCALRASIAMEEQFRSGFLNERFFFDKFGPLNSDDDNYITRYVVKHGWDIKFQNDTESENLMYTTLGINGFSKFHGQLLRWARSQWRSNSASLLTDRTVWRQQWWTTHAAFLTSFINFAIFWDALIILTWQRCTWAHCQWYYIASLIVLSKAIKLVGHFLRHPRDIVFFPAYVVFAYCHAYYKLMALFSFHDTTWSGRKLRTNAQTGSGGDSDNGDEDQISGDHHVDHAQDEIQSSRPSLSEISREATSLPSNTMDSPPFDSSPPSEPNQSSGSPNASRNSGHIASELESNHRHPSISTYSLNSFSVQYGKAPKHTGTANRFTSWGSINTNCSQLLPANVRESQYSLRSRLRGSPSKQPHNSGRSSHSVPSLTYDERSANIQTNHIGDPTIVRLDSVDVGEDLFGKGIPYPASQPLKLGSLSSACTSPHSSYDHTSGCAKERENGVVPPKPFSPSTLAVPELDAETCFQKGSFGKARSFTKLEYKRSFTRGDDCHRVHGDGTHLTLPRMSTNGKRVCRSPEPRYPVLPGRPRW